MKNDSDLIVVNSYPPLSIDEINTRFGAMMSLWKDFLENEEEAGLKYYVHRQNIFEVIKRQDQRMFYWKIFHGLDLPCEYKFIAIECFWINTLKPFIIIDESSKLYDCPNEKFALHLIIATIRAVFKMYKPNEEFVYPSKERLRDILYDFKYCSISREGMISFVETFADTYGVGIEFILSNKATISKAINKTQLSVLLGNNPSECSKDSQE